jgi:hypothetical protein
MLTIIQQQLDVLLDIVVRYAAQLHRLLNLRRPHRVRVSQVLLQRPYRRQRQLEKLFEFINLLSMARTGEASK